MMPGGNHPFADSFFTVIVGLYCVTVSPMKDENTPAPECKVVEKEKVEVVEGKTTEIVLVSQCAGPKIGAIDVVSVLNDPPSILSLVFDPSKWIKTCSDLTLEAEAQDPNDDPLTYKWTIVSGPSGATLTPDNAATVVFRACAPGDYTLKLEVCDNQGACTSLEFPVHVSGDNCCQPPPPDGGV